MITNKEKRNATLGEAIICILFLVCTLFISLTKLNLSAHIPLVLGSIFASSIAIIRLGFTWKDFRIRFDIKRNRT